MKKISSLDNESFFERVYSVVSQIPYGKVTSYGAIAKAIGSAQAARMVGWALNSTKNILDKLPAHRVVNRNGVLTGKFHFKEENLMQKLLEAEGIIVENNKIINFSDVFWNPMDLKIDEI
ncbi:MAG: MGMT family protein [Bacteroidales bacterium]|jgi:methylated-DNA-protein-cysteine methyltransferase-like protein|nr:MGMT family protein [Bacteroidales bacterium]MCK9498704.1 MGMT family protein [Bacteroidales bacterium]MDY0314035.1 MGMT family protein [Bacteroidales bacterium]NLB86659.1 MGMT family protein [Bacteroidales bacterium]